MDTFEGTHLPNVKCSNNELTSNGNKIGTVTDDGVLSPNGEKLEFVLHTPTSASGIPITFNRDCQMIYAYSGEKIDSRRGEVYTRPAPQQRQQEQFSFEDQAEIDRISNRISKKAEIARIIKIHEKAMDAYRAQGVTKGAIDGGRKLTRRRKSKSKSKSKSKKKRRSSHRRH